MEIELISEIKIKIGEKEYPIRIIELSGGIHIINILEKVYGKELEYLECKREKIRVKIGKRKVYVFVVANKIHLLFFFCFFIHLLSPHNFAYIAFESTYLLMLS